MADESILDGLDPYDLLDREADRVHRLFTGEIDWSLPSECAGWTVRDMLAHLVSLEDYTRAGLDDRVAEIFGSEDWADISTVAEFNEAQIRQYADVATDELVGEWRQAQLVNRRELRERGRDGTVDTMVGQYSAWLQTFHFAVEYATHGDDIHVLVPEEDRRERTGWRVRFGEFVLQEQEKPVTITRHDDRIVVDAESGQADMSPEDFVAATQGRLPESHPLEDEIKKLLSTVP